MLTVGIDIGSISAKAAVIRDGQLVGSKVMLTGYNAKTAGEKVFADLLAELDLARDAPDRIVATGYGRNSVAFAHKAVT
jgi:activator of 2-hydroxyglutaryl-CoA dehydratase